MPQGWGSSTVLCVVSLWVGLRGISLTVPCPSYLPGTIEASRRQTGSPLMGLEGSLSSCQGPLSHRFVRRNSSPGLTVCLWKNFPSLLLIYLPIRLLSRLPFVSLSLLQVIMCKVLTGAGGRGRWRANASVIPPLLRRNVSLGSPMGREVQSCWSLFICWEAHPSIKLETIWLLNDMGTRLKKFDNSSIVRRLPSLSSIRNTFDWSR